MREHSARELAARGGQVWQCPRLTRKLARKNRLLLAPASGQLG